jgi:hypothetical protein
MSSITPLVTLLLLTFTTHIVALPNITVIPLIPFPYNPCQYFPGQNTGEPFYLIPSSTTNDTLNNLHNTITNDNTLAIVSDSMVAWMPYRCNTTDGDLYFIGGDLATSPSTFFFTSDPKNRQLRHMATGLEPETYAHEIAGVRQDGKFLGLGNSTTWAFKFMPGPGGAGSEKLDRWDMRLLGKGMMAKEGELEGYLRIVGA